jgi:hypothetical protein
MDFLNLWLTKSKDLDNQYLSTLECLNHIHIQEKENSNLMVAPKEEELKMLLQSQETTEMLQNSQEEFHHLVAYCWVLGDRTLNTLNRDHNLAGYIRKVSDLLRSLSHTGWRAN